MKEVQLSEEAQRFLMEKKAYHIPELKATIYAYSDIEFEEKKKKLINRNGVKPKACPFYKEIGEDY